VPSQRVIVDGSYQPDTLLAAAGKPVTVVFRRRDASLCSLEVVFPHQGVHATLPQDEDVMIELPPSKPGEYEFHCGMGVLYGRLIVQ
jgi:plastocyanin domain-containing protein